MSSGSSDRPQQQQQSKRSWRRRGRSKSRDYVPPSLDSSMESMTSGRSASMGEEAFVTSPPKQRGISGGFGTLFRRAASKERIGVVQSDTNNSSSNMDMSSTSTPSPPKRQSKSQDFLKRTLNKVDAPSVTNDSQISGGGTALSGSIARTPSKKAAGLTPGKRVSSRLFTSNDDSDDSYESRISTAISEASAREGDDEHEISTDNEPDLSGISMNTQQRQIVRYRGYSTSLQSLFLDESLVCASMGCFGLLLSQRTEYLIEVREAQRGLKANGGKGRKRRSLLGSIKSPSKLIAYLLMATLLLMGITFVVYGFGSKSSTYLEDYYDYDVMDDDAADRLEDDGQVYYQNVDDDGRYVDDDDGAAAYNDDGGGGDDGDDAGNAAYYDDGYYNNNNGGDDAAANDDGGGGDDDGWNGDDAAGRFLEKEMETTSSSYVSWQTPHHSVGICKVRDSQEFFWDPFLTMVQEEWSSPVQDRQLQQQQRDPKDMGSNVRLVLGLLFLVALGIVGRRRRMRTRYAIARARIQEDRLFYASNVSQKVRTEEDNYEGACSHTLCGCYPRDPPDIAIPHDDTDDEEETAPPGVRGKKRRHEDCVARGFQCFMSSCCGVLCKCWCQCLSICALAQEAREIRLLVPPRLQRIDYITHQPFVEYQTAVNDLRRGWLGKTRRKAGFLPHAQALSRLSRYILISFSSVITVLVATLVFNPRAAFTWGDAVVLIATFVQSFLVLYVVHWIFHKSDLSVDAVIKFFAAGFAIATPAAFFFEGLLVNITLAFTYSLYTIIETIRGQVFVNWVASHYRLLWILLELFNAYIVAAITEELCKYYTFRTVEHPDLIFLTGLDRESQDERAVEGGIVQYPFGAHKVSNLNRTGSFGSESTGSHRSNGTAQSAVLNEAWIKRTSTQDEYHEDENDVRTYRQKAAAVTTGMISCAVGLACAENFLYVFLLGGTGGSDGGDSGILEEWIVLFFRSIFPVHALAAAMQSINMIRKFVEGTADASNHRIGVGRIILPAVLLHGSFDAVLLGINVYVESAWDDFLQANGGNVEGEGQPYNPVVVNIVAWLSIICIMIAGIMWYYREHRNQRQRLLIMEEQEKSEYKSPTKASEIEFV